MKKLLSRAEARPGRLWLLALAVSAVFLLFASVYTSPLNGYYGYDSPYFLLMGKGICQGMVPYRDLYDQKGPLVFYLNALGYWLTGERSGVFLLQILFLSATLTLLWRCFRRFADERRCALLMGAFFLLYCGTVQEGDMVEEWSLLFSALPMALGLGFLASPEPLERHPLSYSLCYGLCLGAHAFNRATNAALTAGLILAFALLLLRERKFAALFRNAGAVLLGLGLFILPWWLGFRAAGAWDQLVYAAFTHNFHYAVDGAGEKGLLDWALILVKTLPVWLTLGALPRLRRAGVPGRVLCAGACMGLVGAFTMTMGYGWKHYYMNLIPVLLLDLCLLLSLLPAPDRGRGKKRLAVLAVCLACLLPYAPEAVRHAGRIVYCDFIGYSRWDILAEDGAYVDRLLTEDRDRVWGFDLLPRDYLYADVMPCYRYFADQSWMGAAEPGILEEIDAMLQSDPPVWVLVDAKGRDYMEPRLLERFGYVLFDQVPSGTVFIYRHSP